MGRIIIQGEGGLVLKQLLLKDAKPLFRLIDRNRQHLSQYGDNTAAKYPSLSAVRRSIIDPQNPNRLRFGIWDGNLLVGSINITPDKAVAKCAEIGYWIGSEFLRKGYATRAAKALVAHAFAAMRMEIIYAKIDPRNKSSWHVLKRVGFWKGASRIPRDAPCVLQYIPAVGHDL